MHAYGAVPLRALRDEELCPGALRVLTAIAAHDGGGRGCTASNARLGWMARCAERSVSRHISTLTKSNYIRDDGGADGRQRSRYRCLKVVRTPADDAVARGQDASDGGKQMGSVEIHRDTPEWAAWECEFRRTGNRRAREMETRSSYSVPSKWPDHVAS